MKPVDYVDKSDLTYDMQVIADYIGIEVIRQMIVELGGQWLYIPRLSSFREANKRYIKANIHKSVKQLIKELQISQNQVYVLRRELRNENL